MRDGVVCRPVDCPQLAQGLGPGRLTFPPGRQPLCQRLLKRLPLLSAVVGHAMILRESRVLLILRRGVTTASDHGDSLRPRWQGQAEAPETRLAVRRPAATAGAVRQPQVR